MKAGWISVVGTAGLALVTQAADWPMWRYDAARSAASPGALPTNLILLWSRQLPPVRQAWPQELYRRLDFDASYEPVVMGQRLFLGSPNDGSVTAYDTESGEERWKVFTEGPVRCAPACWSNRVYVGSDDGWLYCLEAETGRELWKFRGAPVERPDRRHLGNGHLVSFWPVRGGPVVADGVVYFAAGIWPIFGVFVHALDAESGKVKWTNGELNYITGVRRDHDNLHESGLSPQGYLAAARDRLVVPCGRSMPAGLELATGKLVYYAQGSQNGDCRVAVHGDYAFVGKNAVVNLYDFREVGSKWAYAGTNAPPDYRPEFNLKLHRPDLFESPDTRSFPYKLVEGCDAASVFENGMAYGTAQGSFYAYDIARAKTVERLQTRPYYLNQVTNFHILQWEPPLLWQFNTTARAQPGGVLIKAGPRLYGHAGQKLLALEHLHGEPHLVWEQTLDGTPSSLIAADGKLIVATVEGGLYVFGSPPSSVAADVPIRQRTGAAAATASEVLSDGWEERAAAIIRATGQKSGYCLVLGLSNGRLLEELLKQTELVILGVDADGEKVDALRRRLSAAGLLGTRVELFVGAPFEFLFPPYLANLIVSEDPVWAGFSATAHAVRLFEVLRPYGGTLCLALPSARATDLEATVKRAGLAQAVWRREGEWSLLTREGALPGSAPWTHEMADAAGTLCSQDDLVRAPLGVLWYGDVGTGGRELVYNGSLKKAVSGGRVYTLRETRAVLIAHDAYTGRFLWRQNIGFLLARLAAMSDALYVAGEGKCLVCDPETGRTLRTFTFNTNGAMRAVDIRVDGDAILVECSEQDANWSQVEGYADGSMLVCLNRQTGVELWRRSARTRFTSSGLALGTNMVFCTDSMSYQQAKQAGLTNVEAAVFALDARTGKEVWSQTSSYARNGNDWIVYAPEANAVLAGRGSIGNAWEAGTGKALWTKRNVGSTPLIVRGKTFINRSLAVHDITSGNKLCQISPLALGQEQWPFFGCNHPVGARHVVTARDSSAAYCSIEDGTIYHLRNLRSGCVNSLVAAEGVLNAPNFAISCTCNYAIQTSFALVPMPEVAQWSGTTPIQAVPPPPPAGVPGTQR